MWLLHCSNNNIYKPQPSLLTVHSVQRVLFKYPIIPYLDGLAIEESC